MSAHRASLTTAVLAFGALTALAAVAPGAPADAPDWPVAFDVHCGGDLYLAMAGDVLDAGGLARMARDCVPLLTWRSAPVVDLALACAALPELWVLEEDPASSLGQRRVQRYDGTGAAGDGFPVPGTARYIDHVGVSGAVEVYLAHRDATGTGGRISVHDPAGTVFGGWALAGPPLGLAATGASRDDRPIYALTAGANEGEGLLTHYDIGGTVVWQVPLDFPPIALASSADQAYVIGQVSGEDARVIQYRADATVVRSWPVADFVPLDLVADGSEVWILGHRPVDPGARELRRYNYDGSLLSSCERFPQPSQPTPEGTATCAAASPGAEAWRQTLSGVIAAGPALGADGTSYWATQKGLVYAVDCAGRRKWLFDYRVETGGAGGAQAFEGAPAVDEEGTIYIGDDVVVPNFFFAIRPDGRVKWVQRYEGVYSQIDTSPALAVDGHIYAAAHGWAGGVTHGSILILTRDGRRVRPAGEFLGEEGVGPITNSPVVLADGSAAYLAPRFDHWVLPTGTPPTLTAVPPRPTRTATPEATGTGPTPSSTPDATPTGPTPTATATIDASPSPDPFSGSLAYLPRLVVGSTPPSAHGMNGYAAKSMAGPAQPMPPPYVTQPVPARLRLVRAHRSPDIVLDLPGMVEPSAPATDGRDIWFTALANDGAHLLAYRAADPPRLLLDWNLDAGAVGVPILGRRDPASGELELLIMGADGRLLALAAAPERGQARLLWARFVGLPAAGAPALGDDGKVYVAAGQVVQALDRASGELAWSLALDSPASGSVNLAPGGILHVATASGAVLGIGTGAQGLDPAAAWPAFRFDARNTAARDGGR